MVVFHFPGETLRDNPNLATTYPTVLLQNAIMSESSPDLFSFAGPRYTVVIYRLDATVVFSQGLVRDGSVVDAERSSGEFL